VQLYANIELPRTSAAVKESGATGVGLFRSEFLFMNRRDLPDEDEQYEAYREVVEGMKGMPVTIRTLDIGADKQARARRPRRAAGEPGARAARDPLLPRRAARVQLRSCARSCAPRTTARR
jgi:phosphotransferase system enzyme I (PtsI)